MALPPCPNIRHPKWVELVKEQGTHRAHLAFIRNGYDIPSLARAEELLLHGKTLPDEKAAKKAQMEAVRNVTPEAEKLMAEYAKDPAKTTIPREKMAPLPADSQTDATGKNLGQIPVTTDARAIKDMTRMTAQIGQWARKWMQSNKFTGALLRTSFNKDLSNLQNFLMTSAALARLRPDTMGRLTRVATERGQEAAEIKYQLVDDNNAYIKLPQSKRNAVDAMIVASDRDNVRLTEKPKGWGDDQWAAYNAWGDTMERGKKRVLDSFDDAIEFYQGIIDAHKKATPAGKEGEETLTVRNARIRLEEMKETRAEFVNRKFYMPRVRKGDLVVRGKFKGNFVDADGITHKGGSVFAFHFDNHAYGEKQANDFVSKLEAGGHEIHKIGGKPITYEPKMLDTAIMDSDTFETEALLQQIGQEMGVNDEDGQRKLQDLRDSMKYVFYARGFRQHFLGRVKFMTDAGPQTIRGYQEKNLHEVFAQYVGGLAGIISKANAGKEYRKIMLETDKAGNKLFDPRLRPTEYRAATSFIRDQMRNSDGMDELVGHWSAAAAHMFLGFRVSTALYNGLTVHMFGSAMLHSKMKDGKHPDYGTDKASLAKLTWHVAKAHKDAMRYMKARHTADKGGEPLQAWATRTGFDIMDLAFLNDHMTMAGTQTFAHEISDKILHGGDEGKTGRYLVNRYKELSMWMMQTSEVSGRLGAMLSHYRKFGNKADALQFSKDIHGTYESWNAPSWLKSDDPVMRFMKIPTFTFGTYVQNMYELLYHLADKDKAALGWAFLMATAIGGFPIYNFAAFMAHAMGIAQDPTMEHELSKLITPTGKDLVKSGLFFTPLGVDSSGPMNLPPPAIISLAATMAGKSDLVGENIAVSAVKNSIATGGHILDAVLGRAPYMDIAKNFPVAAVRSAGKIFLPPEAKGRVLMVDGKPVELTPWEQGLVGTGFTPDRISVMQKQVYAAGDIAKHVAAEKANLEDEFLMTKGLNRARVVRKINEFNARLASMKKEGDTMEMVRVRPIKIENIKPKKGINVVPQEE